MVQWEMAGYLKGKDPTGDTPIFHFHGYGRKGNPTFFTWVFTRQEFLSLPGKKTAEHGFFLFICPST